MSGTSELPSLLPLPRPIPLDEFMGIQGMFCYVIKHYGNHGVSLLINRSGGDVGMIVGDWDGNAIPLDDSSHPLNSLALECVDKVSVMAYQVVKHIGLDKAILYFAPGDAGLVLVDARVSLNKFAGPGMLQDVWGKVLKTQEVISVEVLKDAVFDSIVAGREPYSPSLVLKPSRFRYATVGSDPVPLYVEVLR